MVYHVQTEDKGLRTPFILSLVYTGGAILASKRSPYDDLIARGFDEGVLAQRLARQHKLICAAVHAGRIDDLKRLSGRDLVENPGEKKPQQKTIAPEPIKETPAADESAQEKEPVVAAARAQTSERDEHEQPLKVILLEEPELRAGESVTLRVLVSRAAGGRRQPARKARLVVKTLGTNFRPTSTLSTTNNEGIASIPVLLPVFETGRAAVLVRAHIDGETAELRRIILPGRSS